MNTKEVMTSREAARYLGVSIETLSQWRFIRKPLAFCVVPSKRGNVGWIRYRRKDLDAWKKGEGQRALERRIQRASAFRNRHRFRLDNEQCLHLLDFASKMVRPVVVSWMECEKLKSHQTTILRQCCDALQLSMEELSQVLGNNRSYLQYRLRYRNGSILPPEMFFRLSHLIDAVFARGRWRSDLGESPVSYYQEIMLLVPPTKTI